MQFPLSAQAGGWAVCHLSALFFFLSLAFKWSVFAHSGEKEKGSPNVFCPKEGVDLVYFVFVWITMESSNEPSIAVSYSQSKSD